MVIGLVILSQTSALIGDLLLADFVKERPAWLIALNPRIRSLLLATGNIDAPSYFIVGFLRLVGSDPLYYLLGYWYGDRAIAWAERRSRTYGPFIRDGEAYFRRFSYPFIFFAPNNIICALSAATGVRLRTFIALNVTGTVFRLIAVWYVGDQVRPVIEWIVRQITEYRIYVIILSAIGVAWTVFGEFRGDNSELKTLTGLTSEGTDDGSPDGHVNGSTPNGSTPAEDSPDRATGGDTGGMTMREIPEPADE